MAVWLAELLVGLGGAIVEWIGDDINEVDRRGTDARHGRTAENRSRSAERGQ
jgi:hypothetical protein